jgi:hypothetical protein
VWKDRIAGTTGLILRYVLRLTKHALSTAVGDRPKEAREKGWLETDDYALYDMAYPIISTEHLTWKQVIGLYNRSFASFYTDSAMVLRGLLSSMPWKREIWRYMLRFAAKLYLRRYWKITKDLFR